VSVSGNVAYRLRSANEGNTHIIMYIKLINVYFLFRLIQLNKRVHYSIYTLIQLIKKPTGHQKIHYFTNVEVKEAYNKCVCRPVRLHVLSAFFSLTFIRQGAPLNLSVIFFCHLKWFAYPS